jgi:ribose 1,5-bisphosphokinase PhnN
MNSYRITFIRRQAARLDEIASVHRVLTRWSDAGEELSQLHKLIG